MKICISLYWCFSQTMKKKKLLVSSDQFLSISNTVLRTLCLLAPSLKMYVVIFILLSVAHPLLKVHKKHPEFFKVKTSVGFSENYVFLNWGKSRQLFICKIRLQIATMIMIDDHEWFTSVSSSPNFIVWSQADLFSILYFNSLLPVWRVLELAFACCAGRRKH